MLLALGEAVGEVGEAGRDTTGRGERSTEASRDAGVDAERSSSTLGTSMDSEEKKVLRGMGIVCVRTLPLARGASKQRSL